MVRELKIKQETMGSVEVLRLDGALDSYSFPQLEAAFKDLTDSKRSQIVFDCGNLDYINSASLGALIGFARTARDLGGDLKLASLTPKILGIVELLGFNKMLQVFPDVQLAVSKFSYQG